MLTGNERLLYKRCSFESREIYCTENKVILTFWSPKPSRSCAFKPPRRGLMLDGFLPLSVIGKRYVIELTQA